MYLYVIYDMVSDCNMRVLQFENDDVACRFLKNAFYFPNSPFVLNCRDTALIKVGYIDDKLKVSPIEDFVNLSYVNVDGHVVKIVKCGVIVKQYNALVEDFLKSKELQSEADKQKFK